MFRAGGGAGLSINTNSANTFSGSSSATNNNVPGKSLFGNNSTTATSQPATTSLFGITNNSTSNTNQPAGGLFGNLNANNSNPGGTTGAQAQNSASQPATTSLFGGQTNTAPSTSLFGAQSTPQPSNGLFGSNLGQQNQQAKPGGLFGSSLSQPAGQNANTTQPGMSSIGTTQNSLFGAPQVTSNNQPSFLQSRAPQTMFSASIGQQTQQQQTVPGVRISVNELRPTTRFSDLHEELQKVIESVDAFILRQIQWQEQCEASNDTLEELCAQMPPDVDLLTTNLNSVQQDLEDDAVSIAGAKELVKQSTEDASLSFKAINNLKLPQQFHQNSLWSSTQGLRSSAPPFGNKSTATDNSSGKTLIDLFTRQAHEMSKTIDAYKQNFSEVEQHLRNLEVGTVQKLQQAGSGQTGQIRSMSGDGQLQELAAVLRDFENAIVTVAAKVSTAREHVQEVGSSQVDGFGSRRIKA